SKACDLRRLGRLRVFAGRRAEQDPLDLYGSASPEPQCRLKALPAEVASIERAAQLVQRREILLAHLLTGGLQQDQMARAFERSGHPNERLALPGPRPPGSKHDRLPDLRAAGNPR